MLGTIVSFGVRLGADSTGETCVVYLTSCWCSVFRCTLQQPFASDLRINHSGGAVLFVLSSIHLCVLLIGAAAQPGACGYVHQRT